MTPAKRRTKGDGGLYQRTGELMSDLTEFLLARLAEDEKWAQVNADSRRPPEWTARVLADVEAKRRIVAFAQHAQALRDNHADAVRADSGYTFGQWSGCHVILRHLAAVYADHPDYRDDWRP